MNIKNREKLLLLIAGVVIALLAGDYIVISPLSQAWKARQDRIAILNKDLSDAEVLVNREKAIRERWSYMQSNALPANVAVAEHQVLSSIERWVQTSSIKVSSKKLGWRQGEDYLTLECQAEALGDIRSLSRFVYELEKDSLALKVEELGVTARDAGGQQLALDIRFTGLQLSTEQK